MPHSFLKRDLGMSLPFWEARAALQLDSSMLCEAAPTQYHQNGDGTYGVARRNEHAVPDRNLEPFRYKIKGVEMAIKASVWVHGTAGIVEDPERLADHGTTAFGWGLRLQGQSNATNWVHYAVTTPAILDDIRAPLVNVFVCFVSRGRTAITNVHLYDGVYEKLAIDGLNLYGDHTRPADGSNQWRINPPLTIFSSLGISLGIRFAAIIDEPAPAPELTITSVGVDFTDPTR